MHKTKPSIDNVLNNKVLNKHHIEDSVMMVVVLWRMHKHSLTSVKLCDELPLKYWELNTLSDRMSVMVSTCSTDSYQKNKKMLLTDVHKVNDGLMKIAHVIAGFADDNDDDENDLAQIRVLLIHGYAKLKKIFREEFGFLLNTYNVLCHYFLVLLS